MPDRRADRLTDRGRKWHEIHERMYAAALREFERVGFDSARIEHICRNSGVTRPTFYAHFETKEGVLNELVERLSRRISTELEKRIREEHDVEVVFEEFVSAVEAASSRIPKRLRRDIMSHLPRRDAVSLLESPVQTQLAHAIERAVRKRELMPCEPDRIARRVTVAITAFSSAYPESPEVAAREARELLSVVFRGLRPRRTAGRSR